MMSKKFYSVLLILGKRVIHKVIQKVIQKVILSCVGDGINGGEFLLRLKALLYRDGFKPVYPLRGNFPIRFKSSLRIHNK